MGVPEGAVPYKTTPIFNQEPDKSRRVGCGEGLGGEAQADLLEPEYHEIQLQAGEEAVVAPGQPHRVALLGPVRFQIQLYRGED